MAKRQSKASASAQSAPVETSNPTTTAELARLQDRVRRRFDEAADAVKAEWKSLVLNSSKEQSDRFDRVCLNLVAILGYLRDFHVETFSTATNRTQRAFHSAAAVSCLWNQTLPSILDAIRFLTVASPVFVFGRESKSHSDGILWWAATHDGLFCGVGGFPTIEEWSDEIYAKVLREIGYRDYFKPFIEAITHKRIVNKLHPVTPGKLLRQAVEENREMPIDQKLAAGLLKASVDQVEKWRTRGLKIGNEWVRLEFYKSGSIITTREAVERFKRATHKG